MKLLIANRGEIAVRIARAAADLAIPTVAVFSEDDVRSRHVPAADEARALNRRGAAAYLDTAGLLTAAAETGCDAVHPGYGFVSENPDFAAACAAAGVTFVGPPPGALALFGDKVRARGLAAELDVPLVAGTADPVDAAGARNFLASLDGGAMLLKAVGGGGGRGMRIVRTADEVDEALTRAASEAGKAFGVDAIYAEQLIENARHVEVQVIADGAGGVLALGDRDCSVQRRHQKIIEIAPAPALPDTLRAALADASVRMARAAGLQSLATFEFLVYPEPDGPRFAFIETNPRLQVEHTVTEAVTGLDLVQLQLHIAGGAKLAELGLGGRAPAANGFAIQARVNTETMTADGDARPTGGLLATFDAPSGPGLRTDTAGYAGYATSAGFDSLLAKVIAHVPQPDLALAARRLDRALSEFRIEGVGTNISFLRSLLARDEFAASTLHTRFVDEHAADLLVAAAGQAQRHFSSDHPAAQAPEQAAAGPQRAGVRLASSDPLAVLAHGKSGDAAGAPTPPAPASDAGVAPDGQVMLAAPMQGTVISFEVEPGGEVLPGTTLLIMEAMKMEHEIVADTAGVLRAFNVDVGDAVYEGHALAFIEPGEVHAAAVGTDVEVDLDHVRDDVAEVIARHEITLDPARPDAVAKRRRTGQRTARENIDALCDPDSFVEHGQLALTPGTGLPREEVIRKFPTDGMITGLGSVNGDVFDDDVARTVVMAYDYTVLAGTQGAINHPKTDRMLELAHKWQRPLVLFAEGGGGRAGTGGKRDGGQSTSDAGQGRDDGAYRPLDTPTFASMGRLSGLVPMVGITSRFCFAGNASLLGCCDVIIATKGSNIGMGGPALIEGGGLGVFRPEEIGPLEVQEASGVVDVSVEDEVEAVAVARQYLSYFQGPVPTWEYADQRYLRHIIPENRLRMYNVREVISTLADTGSVLELRPKFGLGMVTAFIRIDGRPIGVLANNPGHLSGAIDSDGSDKAARFLQLCDAFDVPVLVLCDTPGMMVGPEVERTGLVRHCSRLFVIGANLSVPIVTIVLRKAYGLGAQAMAGGSMKEPFATVAWPTGEFGGMGLEGQVKLGFRNELEAIDGAEARAARYQQLVDAAYRRGKALNSGASFAVDDVIDPADSRRWVTRSFDSAPLPARRTGKKRPHVDVW